MPIAHEEYSHYDCKCVQIKFKKEIEHRNNSRGSVSKEMGETYVGMASDSSLRSRNWISSSPWICTPNSPQLNSGASNFKQGTPSLNIPFVLKY